MSRTPVMTERQAKAYLKEHFGPEPTFVGKKLSHSQLSDAYYWYHNMCDPEDAQTYLIEFLRNNKKLNAKTENILSHIPAWEFPTIGWTSRIISRGASVPSDVLTRLVGKINELIRKYGDLPQETEEFDRTTVNIQKRTEDKALDFIGDIEEQIDEFLNTGNTAFSMAVWLSSKSIKPLVASKIANYYRPLYSELHEAVSGKDKELASAYSHHTKTGLKNYLEFVRGIISACESAKENTVRKPRKRKVKSPTQLVAKLHYLKKDETYHLTSVSPERVIGAQQLWVFNVKYRTLVVYNAMGPSGLSVKGSTLQGYDPQTSIGKRLRKPESTLKEVLEGGKVSLRHIMSSIRTKEIKLTGRINSETILLRAG